MAAFPILLFAIVIIFILVGTARARDRARAAWRGAAEQLGLALIPGDWRKGPRIEGEVEGLPLTVDILTKGSGQYQSTWTRFRLGVPMLNLGLELKEEGFLSSISKAFGAHDIEVGDAAFDDRVLVKGRNAGAIREFLNPQRRTRIQRFFASHRGAVINDQGITWAKQGRMSQESQILAAVREMVAVGGALAPSMEPEPPPEREQSAATEPGRDSEPAPRAESEPAADESDAAESVRAEPAATVGAAEFSDTVFAPGSLSYAAAQTFRERYQGQRVSWSGTLRSATPYSFDFVFGSGGGIKAAVTIHKVDGASIGGGEVSAVIQLPADTAGLEAKLGERVSFSGTLIKVDGLKHEVYLSKASLGE